MVDGDRLRVIVAYARDPTIIYIEKVDRLCVMFNAEEKESVAARGGAAAACGNDGSCQLYRSCKSEAWGEWEAPVALAPHLDAECAGFIQGRPVGVVLPSVSAQAIYRCL